MSVIERQTGRHRWREKREIQKEEKTVRQANKQTGSLPHLTNRQTGRDERAGEECGRRAAVQESLYE